MSELFEPFPKLTRFTHDWTITEKIDGSNCQILVVSEGNPLALPLASAEAEQCLLAMVGDFRIFAGSRNRLLAPGKQGDHHGFAAFVKDKADEIVRCLGEGRHYGEWYGQGVGPRGYGINPKRFALFNAGRWTGQELPDRFDVVPILFQGYLSDSSIFDRCMSELETMGSRIAPNFMKPEGIVMYHGPSRTSFKRTFEYDEAGKWAENQARRETT